MIRFKDDDSIQFVLVRQWLIPGRFSHGVTWHGSLDKQELNQLRNLFYSFYQSLKLG